MLLHDLPLALCAVATAAAAVWPHHTQQDAAATARVRAPEFAQLYGPGGICDPSLIGTWRLAGYGAVASLQEDTCQMYSVAGSLAWELPSEDFIDGLLVVVGEASDRRLVTSHVLETPYTMERIDVLPEACREQHDWTPMATFEAYAATMEALYPFFEVRGHDWQTRLSKARSRLTPDLDNRGLFELIDGTLTGLGDGHMQLEVELDGEELELDESPPLVFRRMMQAEGWKDGDTLSDEAFGRIVRPFGPALRAGITERILHGKSKRTANRLVWGRAAKGVGYLVIPGMGGYSESGDLTSEVEAIHAAMDEVLEDLDGIEALIVDVSLNGGGMDTVSHAFASHFADERRLAYSKGPATRPDIRHRRYVEPAAGRRFTGPTYVVSSDLTASAAEIFQLCMKVQPQVTLVGASAAGIFSDVVPKPLPNGWELGMSIEVYEDAEGVCHEGSAVPLDVSLPIFEGDDVLKSHAEAIEAVVRMATL